MVILVQTVIMISESICLEGTNVAFSKFFTHVYKCRLLANAKLKVSSDRRWQKLLSLCNFWIKNLTREHSLSCDFNDDITEDGSEEEILSFLKDGYSYFYINS